MLVLALLSISTVRFGLGVLPFKRSHRVPEATSRHAADRGEARPGYDVKLYGPVFTVGRRLIRDRLRLVKVLSAQGLFRRDGHDVGLRTGVDKIAGSFRAHAWMEWKGRVISRAWPHKYSVPQKRPSTS